MPLLPTHAVVAVSMVAAALAPQAVVAPAALARGDVCVTFCEDGSQPPVNRHDDCPRDAPCGSRQPPDSIWFDSCGDYAAVCGGPYVFEATGGGAGLARGDICRRFCKDGSEPSVNRSGDCPSYAPCVSSQAAGVDVLDACGDLASVCGGRQSAGPPNLVGGDVCYRICGDEPAVNRRVDCPPDAPCTSPVKAGESSTDSCGAAAHVCTVARSIDVRPQSLRGGAVAAGSLLLLPSAMAAALTLAAAA